MAEEATFYRAQAQVQRAAADTSMLANVRQKFLQAAASWDRIAEQSEACERRRIKLAAPAIA